LNPCTTSSESKLMAAAPAERPQDTSDTPVRNLKMAEFIWLRWQKECQQWRLTLDHEEYGSELSSVANKKLSIRNQLKGTVQQILRGSVVSEVVVETAAGLLASVITTRSVRDLKLKRGDRVFVMVKATEASIQKVEK